VNVAHGWNRLEYGIQPINGLIEHERSDAYGTSEKQKHSHGVVLRSIQFLIEGMGFSMP
jgi:hypothetical protein